MSATPRHGSARGLIVVLIAVVGLAVAPTPAGAVATVLKTFKTSIDVKLNLTERSIWQGIRPGCFAPQEDFDMTYKLRMDSRPNDKGSKLRNGVASLTPASFGVTPSYGDRKSFRQYSIGAPWTLETQYQAGCDGPAPAPPDWAVAPTCKAVNERVEASLLQNTIDDPDDPTSNLLSDDGVLLLVRSPKASPTVNGANIGESCLRTLHNIEPMGDGSLVAIGLKQTLISVPIPNLQGKLKRLARGKRKSHPSFRIPIDVGGDCKGMWMKPTIGPDPDFVATPFSQPHNALGSFNGDATKSVCMISGSGSVTVRREGAVRETLTSIHTR